MLATFRQIFPKPSDFQTCTEAFSELQILMQKNARTQNFPFKKCKIHKFPGKIWKISPFWPPGGHECRHILKASRRSIQAHIAPTAGPEYGYTRTGYAGINGRYGPKNGGVKWAQKNRGTYPRFIVYRFYSFLSRIPLYKGLSIPFYRFYNGDNGPGR